MVSASDAVLKPMFLGRGLDIPMLVILIGALGGMMMSGIIGLFVGAIVMALSYRLFMVWLTEDFDDGESEAEAGAEKTLTHDRLGDGNEEPHVLKVGHVRDHRLSACQEGGRHQRRVDKIEPSNEG